MGLELYRTLWLRGMGLWLDVRVWRIGGVWGVSPGVEKHTVEASTQHEKNTVACAKTLLGRPPSTPVSKGIKGQIFCLFQLDDTAGGEAQANMKTHSPR